MLRMQGAKPTLVVLDPELINVLLLWYPYAYSASQVQVCSCSHMFQEMLGFKVLCHISVIAYLHGIYQHSAWVGEIKAMSSLLSPP